MLFKDYKFIREPSYIPLVQMILVLASIVGIIQFCFKNYNLTLLTAILSLFISLLYQSYRSRKCPQCNKSLKRYTNNALICEIQYCMECKIAIETGIINGDTAA